MNATAMQTITGIRSQATCEAAQDYQPLITREIPRLCRGGSKSLTVPAIAPQARTDETLNASREAHERIRSMTGRRLSQELMTRNTTRE